MRSGLLPTALAIVLGAAGCELITFVDRPSIPAGTGGTSGSGGGSTSTAGGGGARTCLQAADCPGGSDCVIPTCEGGQCGTRFAAAGTPTSVQVARDCQRSVCDGQGSAHLVPDDGDVPAAGPCTAGACDAGVPSHPPAAAGTPCSVGGGTLCDGAGHCVQCVTSADCASGLTCMAGACAGCTDGKKDGSETDVDCGGPVCSPCGIGKACGVASDCGSGSCVQGKCAPPASCADGTKDGNETGVDCGGPDCLPCGPGQPCHIDADCAPPDTCGGGTVSGVCGCTPKAGACSSVACGTAADGCGGTVTCPDTCSAPLTCGGGGKPNACGCPSPTGCFLQTTFAKRWGGPQDDDGFCVAIRGSALALGGSFLSPLDFGGGPLMPAGQDDAYVAMLDPMGGYVWARRFGDAQAQFLRSSAFDGTGNLVVTGFYGGSIDFGGGPLVAQGTFNVFLAKLDPSGGYLWAKSYGGAYTQQARGVFLDGAGNIYLSGLYQGTIDFGGGPLPPAGAMPTNIFVAKLDPAGGHLYSHGFGGAGGTCIANGIAGDAAGNVVIAGQVTQTIDFGAGPLTPGGGASNTNPDIAVAAFTAAGALRWAKLFGDAGVQKGLAVAVRPDGGAVLTGFFAGTVDFGGGPLTATGVDDVFLARFDAQGNHVWSRRAGGAGTCIANAVVLDPSDNVIVTGSFNGTLDCGVAPITSGGAAPSTDVFVLKYSPSGQCLHARRYGGTSPTDPHTGRALATDAAGNVYVYGDFQGSLDVGAGAPLVSNGALDTFLIELTP
jgi:hypothetical protein